MKHLIKLLLLGILGGGWVLSAAALYVVRTPDRVVLLTKNRLGFADTYVDARLWTLADAGAHPKVIQRMVDTGKEDALAFLTDAKNGDLRSQLLDAAVKGPPVIETAPPAAPPQAKPFSNTGPAKAPASKTTSIFDF